MTESPGPALLAESRWLAEARKLIAEHGYNIEYDADLERHRIDGMPVTDGQVVELAIVLGKPTLDAA